MVLLDYEWLPFGSIEKNCSIFDLIFLYKNAFLLHNFINAAYKISEISVEMEGIYLCYLKTLNVDS